MHVRALTIPFEELRKELPLAYVFEWYGHRPTSVDEDRIYYRSPWRDDSDPSVHIFRGEDGAPRVGDFAAGLVGDLYDLIGWFEETDSLVEKQAKAREVFSAWLESDWDGPDVGEGGEGAATLDFDQTMGGTDALSPTHEAMASLAADRPEIGSLLLASVFGVRQQGGKLVIPYPDRGAVRYRFADGSKTFAKGSKPRLYHALDAVLDDGRPVLVVEGESDTWAAYSVLHQEVLVVGVAGAGQKPEKYAATFEGRSVALGFDGDKAGREATDRWLAALSGVARSVSVVPMPEGEDWASLPAARIRKLYERRRIATINTSDLIVTPAGYAIDGKEPKIVSNWVAHPVRVFHPEGQGPSYEVEIERSGATDGSRHLFITSEDLASASAVHKWAQCHGIGAWWGGQTDHRKLAALLQEAGTFLPLSEVTARPGLVVDTFVWPGGRVGNTDLTLIMGNNTPWDESNLRLPDFEADGPATLARLLDMHRLDVMSPILSWLALAPLRSKFKQFPVLDVTGPAGSGKTTLVGQVLKVFSGVELSTNLTSTTRYALSMTIGTTNAFPVWVDEFRPGASRDAMLAMEQIIRDAYNAAVSRRGGLTAELSVVTATQTDSPLVISGEDFADEQSHRDRIVRVVLPLHSKGVIPDWAEEDHGFARDYLAWLTESPDGVTPPPVLREFKVTGATYKAQYGITDRQAYNLAMLDLGWSLLRQYVYDRNPDVSLPESDWSALISRAVEMRDEDPVMEALTSLYEHPDSLGALVLKDGMLYVSAAQTIPLMNKHGITLPFRHPRALTEHLLNQYEGAQSLTQTGLTTGKRTRYVAVPVSWEENEVD